MIFRVLALLLMVVFYGCYFGKRIAQKKKGINTTQIGNGKMGFVKWVECTMMIAYFVKHIINVDTYIARMAPRNTAIK